MISTLLPVFLLALSPQLHNIPSEIRWQRGEGPVLKIMYRWRTGR